MNWQALIDRTRLLLDDGAQPYLWSEAELTYNAVEAVKEACLRAYLIQDASSFYEITLIANQAAYDLDNTILYVLRAKLVSSDFYLKQTSFFNLQRRGDGVNFGTGTPTHYALDKHEYYYRQIVFLPTPKVADTAQLEVVLFPSEDVDNIDLTQEIPLDAMWQDGLTHWMLALAFQKRDSDVYNPQKALEHEALFTQRFGERLPAYVVRDRMTRAPMEVITE